MQTGSCFNEDVRLPAYDFKTGAFTCITSIFKHMALPKLYIYGNP